MWKKKAKVVTDSVTKSPWRYYTSLQMFIAVSIIKDFNI